METLIQSGFKPTRTLVLSFGFDEEISGYRVRELILSWTSNAHQPSTFQGASKLAQALLEIYGEDGVAFLVDEGGMSALQ